jgi:RHS repeat-associated protein
MAGISSKAAGKLENKKQKFQGQELDDDLGLNWYGFKWRNHDPQIGRFIEVDPLSEKYVYNSTYAFSENKVTAHVELEGLEAFGINTADAMAIASLANKKITEKQINQVRAGETKGQNQAAPYALGGIALAVAAPFLPGAWVALAPEITALQGIEIGTGSAAAYGGASHMASAELKAQRMALADEWMGDANMTKYVDFNKKVYTSNIQEGVELVQFRLKGSEGFGNYYAPVGTKPEQIGLISSEIEATYKVTVDKTTKVLNSTHTTNATYYRNESIKVVGGGKQIYSPELQNNATFTKIPNQ